MSKNNFDSEFNSLLKSADNRDYEAKKKVLNSEQFINHIFYNRRENSYFVSLVSQY